MMQMIAESGRAVTVADLVAFVEPCRFAFFDIKVAAEHASQQQQ